MKKEYVTWNQVEQFVNDVTSTKQRYSGVYGLPRGGLVLAVMISHKLDIPLLMSPSPGCLIVDDICDSGESLLHYYKNSSGEKIDYTFVTMYYKENALHVVPDIWGYHKTDSWVVFPWEVKEV